MIGRWVDMSWLWAALTPHPPIIVPGIGGGREKEAAVTLKGVADVMERVRERKPEAILLLSPHQPYTYGAFALNGSPVIKGGLAIYGTRNATFELRAPRSGIDALAEFLAGDGVQVSVTASPDLDRDQGSSVPLYFLRNTYGGLPDIVLSSPIGLDRKTSLKLGEAMSRFDDGRAWGLLASGDLSHRLKSGAPAGYSPMGEKFDAAIVESLKKTDPSPILELSRGLIEDAGECGMRSVLTMLGMVSAMGGKIDVLSYEGPYGVGYCNAVATF
jgi:aromatic ring-opening dioxygenase LigB subunit